MRSVPTPLDPSVSFTVLPIELGDIGGVRTRIEMVSAPGAPEQAPTRKQLLDEVDGIVFVVDAQRDRIEENVASLDELRKALADYARSIEQVPLVVQYNKRDLTDPYALEELHRRLGLDNATVFEAIATEGSGLLQTLSTISKKVIRTLRGQRADGAPESGPPPLDAPAVEAPPAPPEPQEEAVLAPPDAPLAPQGPGPELQMEEAILHEAEHPQAAAIEAEAQATEDLLDQPWQHGAADLTAPLGARIDGELSIVSVGEATRADERSVRLPIVLGDGEGATSTLVLTIRLDPLVDEVPD
jgi:signal recognition particle receptor subunit beta